MSPLLLGALVASSLYGGYKFFAPKLTARHIGDKARIGDEIYVKPLALPVNLLPSNFLEEPYVVMLVAGMDKERVQGPIIGTASIPRMPDSTQQLGSFVTNRSNILRVIRNGETLT